ncbi:MAG: O-acetyl-ADP-ribose deacetylase [Thermoplasmatota archaeon]
MEHMSVGDARLELTVGDITLQETDAVVNAANKRLAPGGGVAGAIHRAAGPELWEECKELQGCRTGEAKITRGYHLPASYVIHTVGPVYSGRRRDAELLEACYHNALQLAREYALASISFPALSTGAFGYPLEKAARVALPAVIGWLEDNDGVELVRFVLYDREAHDVHLEVLQSLKR